jgi:tetratricopeptide (TPR) repeat protein
MRHLVSLLLVPLFLLAGCAAVQPSVSAPPPALFADSQFKPPSQPVGADDLFTLSPAMRDYLHSSAFNAHVRASGRERGLVNALYSASDLMLAYDNGSTLKAAETYAARSGNCLSLVIMTAAFAKELGLTTRYQSVEVQETWSREGGLYLAASHVNIVLGRPVLDNRIDSDAGLELVVDFLPQPEAERFHSRGLEEKDIIALFNNNRAVENLTRGRLDDAYWWARAAVMAEPRNAVPYNTLGVIYERHNQPVLAEIAFRATLEREPENLVAMQNLGPLLASMGRKAEAAELERRVASIQPTPPYYYFDKGMEAMRRADYDTAKGLFERELKRAPYSDEFHFWLAVANLRLGDTGTAREQLALAIQNSTRRDMHDAYSAKLANLKRQSAALVKVN